MEVLTLRSKRLLKALIERYIREGKPVGSKTLAGESSVSLSAATIRNIMADLEDRGYLSSPHTSSGRVPTPQGLRFFVDSLLTSDSVDPKEAKGFQQQLLNNGSTEDLIESTSTLLSSMTQLVGLVSLPRREQQLLRRVDFLPLSGQRVLVILVLNEEEVQNRIIRTEQPYLATDLEHAANYLNASFAGKDLVEIRTKLSDLLKREREHLNQLMRTAIEVADIAFQTHKAKNDYILAGENHLLASKESLNSGQLRKLYDTFEEKRGVLQLLDECIKASGVQIFIGEEASGHGFEGCSVVTSAYSIHGQAVGALGVIGPTRMPYQKVIPWVDLTAKLLTQALNQPI